jgi:nitrous oxidase accessory protein
VENAVIDNVVQVQALSGSIAHAPADATAPKDAGASQLPHGAVWMSQGRGNYWSDYRGFDANNDGVGDQAYLPRPAFAGRLADDPTLQLFQYTVAQQAIDLAADMFPVFRYDAVIEDGGPLMEPPEGLGMPHGSGPNIELLLVSGLLAAGSAAVITVLAGSRMRIAIGARARPSLAG